MCGIDLHACPDFLDAFTDFIDGALDPEVEAEVLAHVDCCEGCLRHLRAYREGVGAYRAIDFELQDDFAARLKEILHRGSAWDADRGPHIRPVQVVELRPRWVSVPAASVAIAAMVAFVLLWSSGTSEAGRMIREGNGAHPVSIARVIAAPPTDLVGDAMPAATRAASARQAAPIVRSQTSYAEPNDPEPADVLRAEDLEREFARQVGSLQDAWTEASVGWVRPTMIPAVGLRPVTLHSASMSGSRIPSSWILNAALRVP